VIVGVTLARVGFGNVPTQRRASLEALRAEAALVFEFMLKFLSIYFFLCTLFVVEIVGLSVGLLQALGVESVD